MLLKCTNSHATNIVIHIKTEIPTLKNVKCLLRLHSLKGYMRWVVAKKGIKPSRNKFPDISLYVICSVIIMSQ